MKAGIRNISALQKDGQTIREEYTVDQLVDKVNRKEWDLDLTR